MKWNHRQEQVWFNQDKWVFYDEETTIRIAVESTPTLQYTVIATSGEPIGGMVLFNPHTLFDNHFAAQEAGAVWFNSYVAYRTKNGEEIMAKASEESMPCGYCKVLFPPSIMMYAPNPALRWICPSCHDKWKDADPLATIDNPDYGDELPNTCADCENPLVLRGRVVIPDGKTICYACWTKRSTGTPEQAA